jgi:hypothetical protein
MLATGISLHLFFLILRSLQSRRLEGSAAGLMVRDALRAPHHEGLTSHVPDFFRHLVKRRMPVDLRLRRLEHHSLLGRI